MSALREVNRLEVEHRYVKTSAMIPALATENVSTEVAVDVEDHSITLDNVG